jgi:hypothetical protein
MFNGLALMGLVICEDSNLICIVLGSTVLVMRNIRSVATKTL